MEKIEGLLTENLTQLKMVKRVRIVESRDPITWIVQIVLDEREVQQVIG